MLEIVQKLKEGKTPEQLVADGMSFMGSDPINGDHTYGVDDENMSIVSVEAITNTGAKLDKDNTAISSSVKSVTIKKITFTVDSGAYKVDITKDISSNPYVISFK